MAAQTRRFVILPTRGIVATTNVSRETLDALAQLQQSGVQGLPQSGFKSIAFKSVGRGVPPARGIRPVRIRVIASIRETGAKLVEMSDEDALALRMAIPGLRVVPEVRFQIARAPRVTVAATGKSAFPKAKMGTVKLKVVTEDGKPLPDVIVVAFTNWAQRIGAEGRTKSNGEARLALPAATKKLERIFLYAEHTGWPMMRSNVSLDAKPLKVPRIALDFKDSRARAYAPFDTADGRAVKVGILDTGAGPHAALTIAKGVSAVTEETDKGYNDTEGHGTHVAGVIAAHAAGFTGIAASVALNIYRVFPRSGKGASNFDIASAMDMAIADGCDLINMSLGGGPMDTVTDEAIKEARAKGTICVIAAGNDSGPVSNPGRHPLAICVSAMGYKGAWPNGAVQVLDVTKPPGKGGTYIARFSNFGLEVDLTGTGCGIISTYPQNRYAVMDGTSMACPCTTGAIARLLARNPQVLEAARDAARGDRIVQLALTHARDLGFPATKQGAGLSE